MRSIGFACLSSFAGVTACSLLLDTESLQGGTTATSVTATTGAGGSGQGGAGGGDRDAMATKDAPAFEAGRACNSDTDCLPGLDVDGCTLYTCGGSDDRTCKPPKPNTGGLGIVAAGPIDVVMTADEIGYPSVLADGSDFVMGAWHKTGAATDVLLVKYPPSQGAAKVELSALAPGVFRSYGSSPGFVTRTQVPRKIRMLLAAERLGDAGGMGMRLVDLDVPTLNNNVKLANMQPADPGVGGYDTPPRSFPPRMIAPMSIVQEPAGMWIQQEKLYYFDGTVAAEGFGAKRVLGFSPLGGPGVHAALETAEPMDGGSGPQRTELWSAGSATLISLTGDQPGPRRGVASTFASEGGSNVNFVAWSFDSRTGIPQFNYVAAFCLGASCSSLALPGQDMKIPAVFPELTSSGVMGNPTSRDVVQSFEVVLADPTQTSKATSVLFAGASRFNFPSPDLTMGSSAEMNPPIFIVDTASGDIGLAPGEVLGPSSVAVTADGQILIAWVVHPGPGMSVLKARRFAIKKCP
jgi:hypothetical protein